jgi:hypothetical protein
LAALRFWNHQPPRLSQENRKDDLGMSGFFRVSGVTIFDELS